MTGRKPYPFAVIQKNNDKLRYTQAQLESRSNEPKIKSNSLHCPVHLSDEAKKEWRRIVKLYAELSGDFICDLDVNTLEVYCEALITYRKAMNKVHETSEIYSDKTDGGKYKINPWLRVANAASITIKKYGEVLLLDPVGRARAAISNKKDEKPVSKFDKFGKNQVNGL